MTENNTKTEFFTLKHLTWLALFTALCVVARLSFTWLPNFTPVTTLVLLICFYWGLRDALIVTNVMLVATAIYLGMGIWVIEQMIAYSLILVGYYFLIKIPLFKKLIVQMLLAFVIGILYGFLMSLMDVTLYRTNFWVYYAAGFPFDLMHATGNFLFMLILKKPLEMIKSRILR